ncbi:MAG: hypothetical protein V1737_04920 [Chloroflexota bacterium]
MKTKADGIPKAFEPYKQREIDLILSLTPTHANVRNLATALGRSQEGVMTVFSMAYSGKLLKGMLDQTGESQDNDIQPLITLEHLFYTIG